MSFSPLGAARCDRAAHFSVTTAHRLERFTDAENIAEQKALERIGFQREGVMRGVVFQHGGWRDSMVYGLLREDHAYE